MADDIVTDLRYCAKIHAGRVRHGCIAEAADEIERLRVAGDALAQRLRWWTDDTDEAYPDHEALRTWEKTRRG